MEKQTSPFRWLVLILLFVNTFFVVLPLYCISPLFQEISKDMPLTKAQMGAIMGMFTLASLFFALIGGGISDRIGSRWAVGISVLIVAIAGALRAYAESAAHIMICMFTMGVGFAVFGPNTPKVLGMWFSPKQLATANGICVF